MANEAARHAEIARRYKWHAARNHNRKPSINILRIAELDRLAQSRHGSIVPDTVEGRALIQAVVDHAWRFADREIRIASWIRRRAPWLCCVPAVTKQNWAADTLAKALGLTMAERTALNIRTIGASDCSKRQRELLRKAKARERERRRRAAKKSMRAQSID